MKQRIVGALVLIALVAIVVPIIMDFHKERSGRAVREKAIGIPPKPKDLSVQVLPLTRPDGPAAPEPSAAAGGAPPKAAGGEPAGGHRAAAAPAPPASAEPAAPAPAPPQAGTAPGAGGGPIAWDVQVGSFSSRANAQALRDKLRSRHYTAYVEKAVLDTGHDRYRVRVGPELLHADAEKLQHKLEKEQKLRGIVVSH